MPMAAAPRRRRGRGCLIALLIVLAIILIPTALILRVPQALGIWKSQPAIVFGQTPNPVLGAAILADLQAGGFPTRGMFLWVFREPGSDRRIAYAMLDPASGFEFRNEAEGDPILDLLGALATVPAADGANVERVAVNFQGDEGRTLMIVTASGADARAYASGSLAANAFLGRIDGWVDTQTLLLSQTGGGE